MAYQKTYQRPDGSRIKIEPVLEVDRHDIEPYRWSYIVYRAAPGQEKFEEVTTEHLEGQAYVTEQEILECQLELWESQKPARRLG